jgi:hypothetical protein
MDKTNKKDEVAFSEIYSAIGQPNGDLSKDEISLKDVILGIKEWFQYLLSKWKIILLVALFGGFFGLFKALNQKFVYTSVTTFVLEEGGAGGGLGQYSGMAALAGIDLGGNSGGLFQGENILELYKSRSMLQQTLLTPVNIGGKRQLLIDKYFDFNKTRVKWQDNPRLKDLSFSDTSKFKFVHDSVLGETVKSIRMKNVTAAKLDKKLSIMKVEVSSSDEQFSKLFNDKLVATVNEFYVKTKTKNSAANVEILQRQTDSVQAVLINAIYSSARTVDATPNLNPVRQILRVPAQRSQLTAESNRLMLGELLKNLELSKLALRKETPLIQVVDAPIYPLTKDRLGKARGMIIGGLMAGFLVVIVLIVSRLYKSIINET